MRGSGTKHRAGLYPTGERIESAGDEESARRGGIAFGQLQRQRTKERRPRRLEIEEGSVLVEEDAAKAGNHVSPPAPNPGIKPSPQSAGNHPAVNRVKMEGALQITGLRLASLASAIVLSSALPALSTELPNVKLGLWEMTWSVQTNGKMPNIDLSKVPAAQQAMAQAMMKKAMAQMGKPHTFKTCIGEEQLKKGASFDFSKDPSCTTTVLKSSSTELQVKQVCTGKNPRTVSVDYVAATPESVSGTAHVDASAGGNAMAADSKMSGNWLAADCGTLKPGQVAKE